MAFLAGIVLLLDLTLVLSFSCQCVDVLLLLGRLLAAAFTMLLAKRFAKSQWPWGRGAVSRGIRRETPLLDPTAISEEQLKQEEKGRKCFSWLLLLSFLYISGCSVWVAVCVVASDTFDFWGRVRAFMKIMVVLIMQLESIAVKSFVLELCAGEAVHLSLHEHPLYWKDVENKGYVECSVCNAKVGEKTGGFLVVQCRKCLPNQWGHGGFQVCSLCYRKSAQSGAGSGALWGDKGPKQPTQLTVRQYMCRLAAQVQPLTLVMLAVSVICSQCLSAYIPKAQGDIITALTTGSEQDVDHRLAAFAVIVAAQALAATALNIASRGLSTRLFSSMSVKLFAALLKQDIAFYDHTMTGQMCARLTMDLGQATSPVHIIIHDFASNIVMLAVGFGICLQSSWRLTILAFTILTPVGHLSREISCWAQKLMASQYTFNCDAQGCAVQALTNIRTVRIFGARDIELEKFEVQMHKYRDVGLKVAWGEACANLLASLVQQGACFTILWYGGHFALKDEFEIGSIVTFTYMWNQLSGSFASLTDNMNEPIKAMSAGQRVFELLDLEPDIREEEGDAFPESKIAINFKDVEFQYQGRPGKVLAGVSLEVEAGKTTAVVGKSGSGKSTLSKLLLRLYDPPKGEISVNGRNLQHLHLLGYRANLGVVSQDTQLFRCSVTENIAYGLRPTEYTMQDVERAASLANAEEFIRCLPDGYGTILGESGQDLSGGQKQRLSIARALVRRPRILLLDEATSALDAENEAVVQQALDSLMQQMQGACTILVIAHRLCTIKHADRIIVLSDGEIVEEGTHEELLHRKGNYASMIARQLDEVDEGPKTVESPAEQAEQVVNEFKRLIKSLPQEHLSKVLSEVLNITKGMMP